jgi:hypothetical protein
MKSQECGGGKMGWLLMNELIILNTLFLNNLSKLDASLFVAHMFQK